jgi:hypothetical protein
MTRCPVCKTPLQDGNVVRTGAPNWDADVDCKRCGHFILRGTAENFLTDQGDLDIHRRAVTSHVIRLRQRPSTEPPPNIYQEDLEAVWAAERLPTPHEQANNFVMLVGDTQTSGEAWAVLDVDLIGSTVGTALSDTPGDTSAVRWLMEHLKEEKLLEHDTNHMGAGKPAFRLTFEGWERHGTLKQSVTESRTAFMAMKFGETNLNRVMAECFKPAAQRAGFELRLLTDRQGAGLIDNQLSVAIRACRFLVADLTHGNQGAYWEAGFAHGLGKRVIYTCEASQFDGTKRHFDTNHHVTIKWKLDDLAAAGAELTALIRNTLPADAKMTDD